MSVNWGSFIAESEDAFAPVSEGNHTFQVAKAEATESSTGKKMFKIVAAVVGGPEAGRTAYNNIVMTEDNPKAMFFFFKNLEALGVPKTFLTQSPAPTLQQVADKMLGAKFTADITHREYNGRVSENFNNLKGVSAGTGPTTPAVGGSVASTPVF